MKDLNQAERQTLINNQLIDINECITAWEDTQAPKPKVKNIESPKTVSCTGQDPFQKKQFFDHGETILAQNKVAAFTAGGQGTRLGYNDRKEAYLVHP